MPTSWVLLDRDFTATRPHEKWTGDIPAIWTEEGWLYLAAVLAWYARRGIGWAMATTQDEASIETGRLLAPLARRPGAGLVVHFPFSRQGAFSHACCPPRGPCSTGITSAAGSAA